MKKGRQILVTALLAGSLGLVACGKKKATYYTQRSYSTSLADDWNPYTWQTNADSSILSYLTEPMVDMTVLNSDQGSWQWIYRAATEVNDVSADHKADLDKYGVSYDPDKLDDAGLVYEIKLNPEVKFEEKTLTVNGESKTYGGYKATAEDYIESAKIMLDSKARNYRANTYYSSEYAIAGAKGYYNSDYEGWVAADQAYEAYDASLDDKLFFYGTPSNKDGTSSLYADVLEYFKSDVPSLAADLEKKGFGVILYAYGVVATQDEGVAIATKLDGKSIAQIKADAELSAAWTDVVGLADGFGYGALGITYARKKFPVVDWDKVGLYAADDETLIYVLNAAMDMDNFLLGLTGNWLVETALYNDLTEVDETTGLKVSTYGSSVDTSISYGVYKLTSFEAEKQMKFEQNPNWWGWTTKVADDKYTTTSEKLGFKVNDAYQPLYPTTAIVIDVMTDEAARQAFEKGQLNDYNPTPEEILNEFSLSSQLYKVDESYTMRFFLDTKLEDLQAMDASKGNQNSVVMSNINFRKAFSLAIDRADWVTKTEGYKPAYSLINGLYYYDLFNDPTSIYRNSDPAMKAICDLYGVEYGEGKQYATLKEAYDSITGYNLDEAKNLMAQAHQELVDAGVYSSGDIKIRVAWKKGALEAADNTQCQAIEDYLNAAIEGSGFGSITLEPVGSLSDRYAEVGTDGNFAIGYGAWGGATTRPFTILVNYCDAEEAGGLHSGRCWDPATEKLKLNVGGSDIEKTWKEWSHFEEWYKDGKAEATEKLEIFAQLENKYLGKYYDIMLATSTVCFLLGYQQDYFTDTYNIVYGFGGDMLLKYNYDDVAWAKYVKKAGGTLNYK